MSARNDLNKVSVRSASRGALCVVSLSELELEIETDGPIQFIDLTDHVNSQLREHHVESGSVEIFSRHTTAAIRVNEAEELLLEDFKQMLRRLCPPEHEYHHNDMGRRKPPIAPDERPNAHSHCMHLLLSTSETIPVVNFRLALGTWQRVFLVELDGPRRRQVRLRLINYLSSQQPEPSVRRWSLRRYVGADANGHSGSAAKIVDLGRLARALTRKSLR